MLYGCKDLERCYQRLALNRSTGGPRDMQLILETLKQAENLKAELLSLHDCEKIFEIIKGLGEHSEITKILQSALQRILPLRVHEGNVIETGFDAELDTLRQGTEGMNDLCRFIEQRYQKETKKSSLKIVEGKYLGYVIEVSKTDGPIPDSPKFILDGQLDGKYRYRTSVKTFKRLYFLSN